LKITRLLRQIQRTFFQHQHLVLWNFKITKSAELENKNYLQLWGDYSLKKLDARLRISCQPLYTAVTDASEKTEIHGIDIVVNTVAAKRMKKKSA
jgi:hypothetical protein